MNCNVEYEEERKFCKHCGEPLIPKIEPISTQKKSDRTEEEKSDGKLICPDCQIVYEFGSSCIQCGSALVRETTPHEKEKPKLDQKKPSANLICPTCKIIYERGDFCIKCESALVPQISPRTKEEPRVAPQPKVEEKPIPLQTIQEQIIEPLRKKLICPNCKIIYERGNSCIRCGAALVKQLSTKEQTKSESSETPEIQLEGLLLQNLEESSFGDVERAKKKKMEVSPPPEVEVKEETLQTETPEQQLTKKLTDDLERRLKLPRKRKVDYRRLFLEVGSITIMVVAGGYFLWSVYSYMTPKEPRTKAQHSKEVNSPVLPNPSPPANVTATVSIPQETTPSSPPPASHFTPSDVVLAETLEIEKIKGLLENIRQANLKKNIDLFISCYVSDFKDREKKKRDILDNWKKFDYLDLSYDLKNPSISGDTAKVKVEWLIKIYPSTGGKSQENKTVLDVTLKKEEGAWKITEVKQGG